MKKITRRILLALNIIAIIALLMSGYSGCVNPVNHSLWAMMGYAFPFILAANVLFVVVWACVRMRMLVVPVIGLLLAYPPIRTYVPVNTQTQPPEDALKVLSYNILGFNLSDAPDGEPNPILRYVVDSDADIVCLQEYNFCCENDSLWEQCTRLYPYRETMYNGTDLSTYVAVYSKFPIINKELIPIKSCGNIAAAFTLDINGKHVYLLNLHLETVGLSFAEKESFSDMVHGKTARDSMKHDSRNLVSKIAHSSMVRAPQADLIHDYIRRKLAEYRSHTDGSHGGIILCGDFNDHPLSYVHRTIADQLTDCYTETGQGPGFSMHYNSMHFRIDNIMCSSNWQPYLCTVDKSISLSDHYPIYCYLKHENE